KHAGLVHAHRHERVVTAQLGIGLAHCADQVSAVVAGPQVGDHLGVGLGGEHRALADQALLQRDVVLDDAVDDNVYAIGRVVVGMGVLLGDPAVGRPACVSDTSAWIRPFRDGHSTSGVTGGGI